MQNSQSFITTTHLRTVTNITTWMLLRLNITLQMHDYTDAQFLCLTVTMPMLEPNSPATIANEAVSAAAPPKAITTRRRKQKTTKTTPLGSMDTNLKTKLNYKGKMSKGIHRLGFLLMDKKILQFLQVC